MLSIAPSATAVDELGAFAVLAVIANPEACKARAEELKALAREADTRIADRARAEQHAQVLIDRAGSEAEKLESVRAAAVAAGRALGDLEAKASALSARASAVSAREAAVKEAEGLLASAKATLENQVKAKLSIAATREQEAAAAKASAEALHKEYETKLAALRNLAG